MPAPLTLLAPLSLVRGGWYYYAVSRLEYQSKDGYYWLRYSTGEFNGYFLSFDSTNSKPQTPFYKGYGLSIRCLVC